MILFVERREFTRLNFLLLVFFELALLCHFSSSEETCFSVRGKLICYFKEEESAVDWETAWQLCNSRNSTLPAIRNRCEQDVFEGFLNLHIPDSTAWTSGRVHKYADWTWLDGRQLSKTDYDSVFLIHTHESNETGLTMSDHPITVENPQVPYHYICQYSGSLCSYFNDTFKVTNGCIRYSSDKRSWYDARNQCLLTGGDLAVLDIRDLSAGKWEMLTVHSNHWIGYRKVSWRWNLNMNASDEDDVKYTNWSEDWDPLTGECVSVNASNGKWEAAGCSEKRRVICQKVLDLSDDTFATTNADKTDDDKTSSIHVPTTSNYISKLVIAVIVLLISNVIVAILVRSYMIRKAESSSSSETQSNVGYIFRPTAQRQSKSNCHDAEILIPDDEEFGQ